MYRCVCDHTAELHKVGSRGDHPPLFPRAITAVKPTSNRELETALLPIKVSLILEQVLSQEALPELPRTTPGRISHKTIIFFLDVVKALKKVYLMSNQAMLHLQI